MEDKITIESICATANKLKAKFRATPMAMAIPSVMAKAFLRDMPYSAATQGNYLAGLPLYFSPDIDKPIRLFVDPIQEAPDDPKN